MLLTDLRHAKVRSLDGQTLGRVYEVHCDEGRITALVVGAGGLIERLTGKREGRRIPWDSVRELDKEGLVIATHTRLASGEEITPSSARRSTR
jgi:sporulation protein YlmC with PRC-barrel domain